MPGPVTYAAVMLLARDRLLRLAQALEAKIALGPQVIDLERQLAYLARRAYDTMNLGQPTVVPPARLYGPAVGDQVSSFAFLGAVAPEFPAGGAPFASLQSWLRDTLHKGSPDEHHERLLASSTDFLLAFWTSVGPAITRELPTRTLRDEALAQMRSVVLGHCCHIATDVISGPYVDALEARLGDQARPKVSRASVVRAIENEVLDKLFAPKPPGGRQLLALWPEPALVPKPFYTAFKEALEAIYGPGAVREGGAPFEALRAEHEPPALSTELLEDAYRGFRTSFGVDQGWTLPEWMFFTSFMYLPALVALPVAAALPMGRNVLRDNKPAGHDDAVALFEAIDLPFAMGALIPLAYTLAMQLSPLGAEGPVIFGWVSSAAQLIAAVFYFATLGSGGAGAKWPLLFALPLAIEIACVVYTLTQVDERNPRRWLLALAGLSHLALGAVFVLLFWAFLHLAPEAINDGEPGAFVGWFFLWSLILGALWMGTALLMRFVAAPIPALPGKGAAGIVARSPVQLIDDTMLSYEGIVDDTTSPSARFFPTDLRPLLKLWWTGGGTPSVRARHDRLEFIFGATTRTVFAPAVPMALEEFAEYLKVVVTDAAGAAGLQAKLYFEGQELHERTLLPPGLVFADHGDASETAADHLAQAALARPLGDSEDHAYVLQAAPRRVKAVLFDRDGPQMAGRSVAAPLVGSGVLSVDPIDATVLTIPVGSATRFTQVFLPGDAIDVDLAAGGALLRPVVAVESDTRLRIVLALPGAPAGTYRRVVRQQAGEEATPAGWTLQSDSRTLQFNLLQAGGGAQFGRFFAPGDVVRVKPAGSPAQDRVVTEVLSDATIRIHRRLDPPIDASSPLAAPFVRVAAADAELYDYLASSDDTVFTGQALMNEAADFGALLCLGATTHLLADADLDKGRFGASASLNKAFQVFRNWNLDRRRVNEWRMLVHGGAVDEKAGDPAAIDFAMGTRPDRWAVQAADGDAVARRLGWVPLLRGWLDAASRPAEGAAGTAPFRPGLPSNNALSRALAFVLDQTPPPA